MAQNPKNVTNLFSNLLMGIFWYQGMGKYKHQIHRIYIGFAQNTCFLTKKKDFKNSKKGNFFICVFYFFCFKNKFQPKLYQQAALLNSIRFFRHQYHYIWLISYIWWHMRHLTSNVIWCQMKHMTSKYDVSQSGQSWYLRKSVIPPVDSMLSKISFKMKKIKFVS